MKNLHGQYKCPPARIGYVPELLPDELIYSWIGRLIGINALAYPKDCLMQLFGNRHVIPCIDLPTLLTPLHQRLGDNSPLDSVAKLLELGTLYPYHRPFLTSDREQSIQNIMLHHGGKGLKVLMGRVANGFGANPPLRFCNLCIKADTEMFGTPYWKRHHQLPGISCCLIHRVHLQTYVSQKIVLDRQRYILPPYSLSNTRSINTSSSQLDFAVMSKDLLNASLPSIAPSIRKHIYSEAIIAAGCCTKLHHVDYESLALCIRGHYNNFSGFVHQQRLLSSVKQPLCWLHTLIERPERSSHPICHLLLIGYLFQNIDTFISLIKSYKRFDSFLYLDICNQIDCKKAHENALIRDTSLSCREVARLLNLSTTTIVCKRRKLNIPIKERRKTLNMELINNIKHDLLSGLPLIEIASRNKVSLPTVYRLRAQSGELSKSNLDLDSKIKGYRKCWLQQIIDNPNTGSTALRKNAPAAYAWLYKHDRNWLTKTNLYLKPLVEKSSPRINWMERDFNLSKQVISHVEEIKELNDRPRISKTLMLRIVGDAMVRRNLHRLPILESYLHEMTESQFDYQIFRIDRAINALIKTSKPLQQSYIQRAARIKKWTPDLEEYTYQRINIFNKIFIIQK